LLPQHIEAIIAQKSIHWLHDYTNPSMMDCRPLS